MDATVTSDWSHSSEARHDPALEQRRISYGSHCSPGTYGYVGDFVKGFCFSSSLMQVVDNQVVLVRTIEREGYTAVQVGGIDHPKIKRVSQ